MQASDRTMSVVRAYHRGWTSKHFGEAARLLSPNLVVDVPINEYPTAESFAHAVASFGARVKSVSVLAEFAHGAEAMFFTTWKSMDSVRCALRSTLQSLLLAGFLKFARCTILPQFAPQ